MVPWAIPGVAKLSIPILNLSIGPVPGNRLGTNSAVSLAAAPNSSPSYLGASAMAGGELASSTL